jgi:uncharacterized membrane protein
MSDLFPITFERPGWLILLALIIPVFWMARRSIGGMGRWKATSVFALRTIVIVLLATALAKPSWEKRGEGLTVTLLIDRSQSIPLPLKTSSLRFLDQAAQAKERREDRLAVITVAKDANIAAMPDANSAIPTGADPADLTATNLAGALELGLAIMPDDTANRIVLASDGNETVDHVMDAAKIAEANNIPIDVIVLEYEHRNEVIFERIIAPARARQGQTVNLKMVLRSQAQASGNVRLMMNGVPVDLNGEEPGEAMHVDLQPGPPKVLTVPLNLDMPGPMQFEARFEPDNVAQDEIEMNNSAVAVTFVGGEGKVLIVDDSGAESEYLIRALQQSNIAIERKGPDELIGGLVALAGYDAIIMCNIPRHAFDDEQDKMFHAYVHDLGGGFVMLGGPDSFGAGGWIDSETSKVLPVKLDPPQTRQMVRGALALVMHSCEMPQGNFWGQKVAIAAIQALSSQDYVGIVEYNWNPNGPNINGSSWAFPMALAGDKSKPIAAAKQMVVGDMPDFDSSMQLAYDGLMSVRAGQRHAIVISDGDPQPPTQALLNKYKAAKITCTTIMVAGHGSPADNASMQYTADETGGNFYNITNPKNLPQIFIKEAQVVSRSLIQEGDIYRPQMATRIPGPTMGFDAVPQIEGYVLTAAREGLALMPMVINTQEGQDPIYAYWNYGLGKSIAFTSDLTGRWASQWVAWPQFQAFWEQSIRWVMRPSSPANFAVNTRQEGDQAIVEVEALEANAAFLNFLQTSAVVLGPDNTASPLPLQQVGPGRYSGQFRTGDPGAYLVNINYASGAGDAQQRGNLQAAVSVPYAAEFRAVKHNAAILEDLALRTGGRVLRMDDPDLINLFEAEQLEIPRSPREIWDLLAIIAAALFVFDVAARRISVDPRWVAMVASRAIGRRGDATTDTVAAWKRTKEQASHKQQQKKAVALKQTEQQADRSVRYQASEDEQKLAIDVGSEIPEDMRGKPDAGAQARPQPKPKSEEDEGDYTSRLLKAKRRAQQQGGDEQKDQQKP